MLLQKNHDIRIASVKKSAEIRRNPQKHAETPKQIPLSKTPIKYPKQKHSLLHSYKRACQNWHARFSAHASVLGSDWRHASIGFEISPCYGEFICWVYSEDCVEAGIHKLLNFRLRLHLVRNPEFIHTADEMR